MSLPDIIIIYSEIAMPYRDIILPYQIILVILMAYLNINKWYI